MEPREYTDEEVRDMFISHIWMLVNYWDKADRPTQHDRMAGLAFSILSMLDGCSMNLPGFSVIPHPHPDDKEFRKNEGTNWFPEPQKVNHDISGMLHDNFYKFEP